LGNYQVENAAVVLAACEVLMRKNLPLELNAIRKGLETFRWPGRLEILPTSPLIIIDGAHNLMAARLLAGFLHQKISNRSITLVIGILDDKPYRSMLKALLPPCHKIILTQPEIDRRLPAERLYKAVKSLGRDAEVIPDVSAAVNYALETTLPDAAVCIAGSLYVVGEAKQALNALGIKG
jgi:dihydrofolate synthase/folylpolyglutamate synthase